MDLISREAVDNAMYDYCHSCDVNESQMENYFCDLPSAFKGMTVGEALKTVFPNAVIRTDDSRLIVEVLFSNEVWNEPYKAEGVSEC